MVRQLLIFVLSSTAFSHVCLEHAETIGSPSLAPAWAGMVGASGRGTGEFLVSSRSELVRSRSEALDYLARHRAQIDGNLAATPARERPPLVAAIETLSSTAPESLTYMQLMHGILAITQLRAPPGPATGDLFSTRFDYGTRRLREILATGVLVLPVFQAEPLSQEMILLHQAVFLQPMQIIESPRRADGPIPENAYGFMDHDLSHAWVNILVRDAKMTDYPTLPAGGPRRAAALAELGRERYRQLQQFLTECPGIAAGERRHVVPLLFEIFHEQAVTIRNNVPSNRGVPTDIRVLSSILRGLSEAEIRYRAERLGVNSGVPSDVATRILFAIRDLRF